MARISERLDIMYFISSNGSSSVRKFHNYITSVRRLVQKQDTKCQKNAAAPTNFRAVASF